MTPKQWGPGSFLLVLHEKDGAAVSVFQPWEGGILAEGDGRTEPLLLKATQGVESIASAHILLFTRESHSYVELQGIWEVWPLSG